MLLKFLKALLLVGKILCIVVFVLLAVGITLVGSFYVLMWIGVLPSSLGILLFGGWEFLIGGSVYLLGVKLGKALNFG
jgi:hypothetical protein